MNDYLGKKLEKIRINKVLPHIKGKLLDIGCGNNKLKDTYGNGIGVDVHDWGNVDILVDDTSKIPLADKSIDTITIIAALNHIPNREKVLDECYRLLSKNGQLVITMIPPNISTVWHFLRSPWDIDQSERGMKEGEVYGLKSNQTIKLANESSFELKHISSFMFGINKLYVFNKK
jgi:SAM-dependent methyltransferase